MFGMSAKAMKTVTFTIYLSENDNGRILYSIYFTRNGVDRPLLESIRSKKTVYPFLLEAIRRVNQNEPETVVQVTGNDTDFREWLSTRGAIFPFTQPQLTYC